MKHLKTAIRELQAELDKSKFLAADINYSIVFNDDPTFDPFRADFWIRNPSDELALREGYYPDMKVALSWACLYPKFLRHTRGELIGKPFFLLPWQRDDVILPMMAWKNPRGKNRVRKADLFCAKKNGKTTLCTGIIVGKMLCSADNIECYNTAFTKSQAAKLFRDSSMVIEASPAIKDKFEIKNHTKRMLLPAKKSFLQTLPGEAGRQASEGVDATLSIMDEIHLMKNRELYDFLELSGLAQADALMLSVSTVGKVDPKAIWTERHKYARDWEAGKIIDLHYFGKVYAADPIVATDPEARLDLKQLAKANPSMIVDGKGILDPEILLSEVREAENNPSKLRNVIQKVFNVSVARDSQKCIPVDRWRECGIELPDLERRQCFLGVDMASHEDLAAIAAYFPMTEEEKEIYLTPETMKLLGFDDELARDDESNSLPIPPGFLMQWAFVPASKVDERELKSDPFYRQCIDRGELIMTNGTRIDFRAIQNQLKEINQKYQVVEMAYDKFGAESILQFCERNFDFDLVQVDQTFNGMSLGTSSFLSLVFNKALRHDGSELMEWCCGNAASAERNGGIKFYKDQSQDKIDPVVAAAMAIGRAVLSDEFYEEAEYLNEDGSIAEGMYI